MKHFWRGLPDLLVPYFAYRHVPRPQADSAVMDDICRLRYEVYCLECHYLSAEEFGDGLERDAFDPCSIHFAGYARSGEIVGTVRLVQPEVEMSYPFEGHCSVFEGYQMPAREMAAEVSRLVVRKSHRRRRGDSQEGISRDFAEHGRVRDIQPHGNGAQRRGNSPLLLLGLYREMYRYSRAHGIRFWYAAMERSLARSLDKMGFRFVPIGPQTDYYGPVAPYIVDLYELNERLHRENRFLAAWFNDERIPLWIWAKVLGQMLWGRLFRRRAVPSRS